MQETIDRVDKFNLIFNRLDKLESGYITDLRDRIRSLERAVQGLIEQVNVLEGREHQTASRLRDLQTELDAQY